jgi:mannosyltransferase
MRARHLHAVAALTLLAGILRFATLDVQSFWLDETITVGLVRKGLGGMLSSIPNSESTPPLYYLLAWGWAKLFGTGEVGLRSLSALIGTATVPVAYAAGALLATRRVGLAAAALAAVNPLLFYYSQEARAYALLALLGAASLAFFARALREPRPRTLGWWAAASAAALATHYFAVFIVAFEAVWLFATTSARRRVLVAVGSVAAVGAALLPLALHQRSNNAASFIRETTLGSRVAQVPKQFVVGLDAPAELAGAFAGGLLVLGGLWLLATRADADERAGARVAAAAAAAGIGVPLVLAVVGVDYLNARNAIAAWLPAALVTSAGFGARSARTAGTVLLGALCALSLAVVIGVLVDPSYQRDNWRGAGEAIGPTRGARAIVATPGEARVALRVYLDGELRRLPAGGALVREIDVVGMPVRKPGEPLRPPRPAPLAPPVAGFHRVEVRQGETFTLARFRSAAPLDVTPAPLAAVAIGKRPAAVLVEVPRA